MTTIQHFEETISKDHPVYQPEKGRYWLYISAGCPFAQRIWITRALKNLTSVIGVTVVHWKLDENGWKLINGNKDTVGDAPFTTDGGLMSSKLNTSTLTGPLEDSREEPFVDGTADPNYGITSIKELYNMIPNSNYNGTFEHPVLWDLKTKTIVNNNWEQIPGILNSAFNDLQETQGTVDILPAEFSSEITEYNDWLTSHINMAVYAVGLAETQESYESNLLEFYRSMDAVEAKLKSVHDALVKKYGAENQEAILKEFFLFNGQITESDLRLYATLIRFDPVYAVHFKLTFRTIRNDYKYAHLYIRNLYWNYREFGSTTNFDHTKLLYFRSQLEVNPRGLVLYGPEKNTLEL